MIVAGSTEKWVCRIHCFDGAKVEEDKLWKVCRLSSQPPMLEKQLRMLGQACFSLAVTQSHTC